MSKKNVLPSNCSLLLGDCEKILDTIENKSIQLIVSSPPYNIGKEYETDSRMSLEEYLAWLDPIIGKICDKLSDTGSVCWQVGSYVNKGQVFPLDYHFFPMFEKRGLQLRNRIIWRYNFGLHASKRLSGRYETLLWLTKSADYKFNLDPIRVPQLYPGKRHSAQKGEKAGKPSGNPLGKNPSDYWEFSGEDAFINDPIWDIPNVKSNHPERTPHPCQFPVELAERCVLAFSSKDDAVLDPFMGVGTSVIAAVKHERNGIGIEKDAKYLSLAEDRISAFIDGELPIRRSGQKTRRPKPTEKVAMIPDAWKTELIE